MMTRASFIAKVPRRGIFPHAIAALSILLLGLFSGFLSQSGYGNPWFDALAKPGFMPPGWVFAMVWTCLYLLMGVVLGDLILARFTPAGRRALALFAAQLLINLAWSPLFFAAHRPVAALCLIGSLDAVVVALVFAVARVHRRTAALLIPYWCWLVFATILNASIVYLN